MPEGLSPANPLPNVGRAIVETDSICFTRRQERYYVLIYQLDFAEVEGKLPAGGLSVEDSLEILDLVPFKLAAESQH